MFETLQRWCLRHDQALFRTPEERVVVAAEVGVLLVDVERGIDLNELMEALV